MRSFFTGVFILIVGVIGRLFWDKKKAEEKIIKHRMINEMRNIEATNVKMKKLKERAEKRSARVKKQAKEYFYKYPDALKRPSRKSGTDS